MFILLDFNMTIFRGNTNFVYVFEHSCLSPLKLLL